ncbi:hypothetical protein Q7P35_005456 [Cladosporium inversicolor]
MHVGCGVDWQWIVAVLAGGGSSRGAVGERVSVVLGSRSNRTGQGRAGQGRAGQGSRQAGRRETTKDTSGARECGWWMDGDLVWHRSGVGKSDHSRLRGGGETDQFQMLCYEPATGARARWDCDTLLESALMVTSRWSLFSGACLRVWHCADGCQQTSMALPSRPFTRVAEQRRVDHFHAPRSPQASGPPGECRARPAPPAATLAPTRRRRGIAATCTHVDVPCRGLTAVCAAGFTCRRAARPAIAPWWCGINCLDVQLSRAGELPTTRETDRVGPPKLCPQSTSLRCVIGHRCAPVAFVALALARMPLQAQAGPSMSVSVLSVVVVLAAVLVADCTCIVCRTCVETAAVPPPRSHSQGCNTLVATATPRFWVRNRFTSDPCRSHGGACGSPWIGGLWSLQPRSSLSNSFSAGDIVAESLYRWMVIDGWLSSLALSETLG